MRYYFVSIQKTTEDKYAIENQGFDDDLDQAEVVYHKKIASYIAETKIKSFLAEVIDEIGNVMYKKYWRDESLENTDTSVTESTGE